MFNWVEPAQQVVCSANVCANGHMWLPTLAITPCPQCKAPLLAIKMEQCPQCNEPPVHMRLRSDHIPRGGAIMPMCQGSASMGEINYIELKYQHAAQEEEKYVEREMPQKI